MNKLLYGNLTMIFCSLFYLAWWLVAFKPGAEPNHTVTRLLLGAAFAVGIVSVFIFQSGFGSLKTTRSLFPGHSLLWGGILVYIALLVITNLALHRMVTTELALIVAWTALELAVISGIYGTEKMTLVTAAVLSVMTAAAAVLSMVCYLLYYNLPEKAGYIDGAVPLVTVAAAMAVIDITVLIISNKA